MIQEPQKKNHLLEGSVMKSIIMISVPVILANTLQTVYQLIDTFWVGRLGASAVAAVSLSMPILFFLISLAMGITMAGSILIAQYNGKGNNDRVNLATGQTFSFVFLIALVMSAVGFLSSEFLLGFLTHEALVLQQATAYLQISFLAIPAMFIFMIFQSSMRGVGHVVFPMIIVSVTVILNFFLDPLLMFGWKWIPAMGVSGVALATLITEYVSAFVGVIVLMFGKMQIRLQLHHLRLRWEWVRKLLVLGIPSSVEMSSRSFAMVLLTFLVSTYGTLVIAAYGIGSRILGFIIIPAIGLSVATSALVGNNLGARQHSRAEDIVKVAMKIGFWTLMVLGIFLYIGAEQISLFFVPYEPEIITISATFIRVIALMFGIIGIQMVIIGALKAAGKTTATMFLTLFQVFSLFVISYLLAEIFGLRELGIWLGYPISNILTLFLALYYYWEGGWLKKELV